MWVDLIQSGEGLSRTKRLTLSRGRENSLCLTAFKLKHLLFLGLKPASLWTGAIPSHLLDHLQLADLPCTSIYIYRYRSITLEIPD